MTLFQLLAVAAVQGVTEFLPVSSSGHLILLPALAGTPDQGLAIDVAVHLGTLLAVILYFRADARRAARGLACLARRGARGRDARLALCLAAATIPALAAGAAVKLAGLDEAMRGPAVVGWATLVFGLVLYWADRRGAARLTAERWTIAHAGLMGLAQCLALIPGTSRSGITITAARALGYGREAAARLSMLMSIPVILASGAVPGAEVASRADWGVLRDCAVAAAFAFLAALGVLALMMRLLRTVSFTPYVIYRVILGVGLLVWAYG